MSCKTIEIKKFKEFLETILKTKVLDYSLKPLTKPGENYGAQLQEVKVKIAKIDGSNAVCIQQLNCLNVFNQY